MKNTTANVGTRILCLTIIDSTVMCDGHTLVNYN